MYRIFFILLLFFTSAFSMTAITVTYPVEEFFLKKIADKTVYIRTLHQAPNRFDLDDLDTIKKYSTSHYFFTFGLEEEVSIYAFLKNRNSDIKTFNMLQNIPTLKQSDNKINPFVWLDPILARDIATNIYEKMITIRPKDKPIYKINYETFLHDLDEIYLDIKKRLDNSDLYGVFSFNNDLDYFTNRFRINNYHREFRLLHINEVKDLILFTRKEHIKHIMMPENDNYTIAQSFKGHIDGKIVEYSLFTKSWKVNLYRILRGIENF